MYINVCFSLFLITIILSSISSWQVILSLTNLYRYTFLLLFYGDISFFSNFFFFIFWDLEMNQFQILSEWRIFVMERIWRHLLVVWRNKKKPFRSLFQLNSKKGKNIYIKTFQFFPYEMCNAFFLFMFTFSISGSILFMGRVMNPADQAPWSNHFPKRWQFSGTDFTAGIYSWAEFWIHRHLKKRDVIFVYECK